MASIDIGGEPFLALSLTQVKTLMQLLDYPENSDQSKVMSRIVQFINDPNCLEWERRKNDKT
jgi:hypothetical protein